jgi:hypothetical protein
VDAHRKRRKFWDWKRVVLVKPDTARYGNRAKEGVLITTINSHQDWSNEVELNARLLLREKKFGEARNGSRDDTPLRDGALRVAIS